MREFQCAVCVDRVKQSCFEIAEMLCRGSACQQRLGDLALLFEAIRQSYAKRFAASRFHSHAMK
jgi:hypothetical protein